MVFPSCFPTRRSADGGPALLRWPPIAFDLLLGYTGVMMFCQASFFGTAVYLTALSIIHLQASTSAGDAGGARGGERPRAGVRLLRHAAEGVPTRSC
ncbi:MAG: hypothetical protein MZU95_00685 [Desulfomicrobium escambiense]|nr:hypothetical protein [Desulfomicrobium escambiense]